MSTRCARRRRACPIAAEWRRPHRAWEHAARDATHALGVWQHAPVAERARAYFAYRVALELEEQAALELEHEPTR